MSRKAKDLLRGLQVALALILLAGCSRRSAPPDPSKPVEMTVNTPAPTASLVAQGADVYEQNCAMCHYDGGGSPVAPPLKGSPVIAASPRDVILAILQGRQGKSVVNGKPFNGLMPAQAYLTDEEIAAVVTYIRKEFADGAGGATPADVAALR